MNIKFNVEGHTIEEKLKKSFFRMAIVSYIILIVGLIFIIATNIMYKNAIKNYGFVQGEIGKLGIEFHNARTEVMEAVESSDVDEIQKVEDSVNKAIGNMNDLIDNITVTNKTNEEIEAFNKIMNLQKDYRNAREQVINLAKSGYKEEALNVLENKAKPMADKITEYLNSYFQIKIDICNKFIDRLTIVEVIMIILGVLTIMFIPVLIKRLSSNLSQTITKPLDNLKDLTREIAQGNLNVAIETNEDDEIGALIKEFSIMACELKKYILDLSDILESVSSGNLNVQSQVEYKGDFIAIKVSLDKILNSLNNTFKEIAEAARLVNGGSEQIASTGQTISESASEEASIIEELSASIDTINEKVKSTTEDVVNTGNIVEELIESIQISGNQMDLMMSAMNSIDSSSKNIKNIIETINDIAEQTNLLALNAAIESARVGEAGKGFAVVAEEVRQLAGESAEAVKKTTELIGESIKAVTEGKLLAENASNSLKMVVESTDKVTERVKSISNSAKDQQITIGEFTKGIDEMENVVQSNSAIAEESAAASEELTAQAETLTQMVNRLKLKE